MAFEYTIDNRPKSAGSGRTITGTFTNGGGDTGGPIALVNLLRTIFSATANPDGVVGPLDDTEVIVSGTTVTIACRAGVDGVWSATGTR
jgi:hypothetical protein